MRAWSLIAVFALLFTPLSLLAQRGGGRASSGHGSFAGHASGGSHYGGMRSGSGMVSRGFAGSRSYSRQSFSRQSFAHQPSFTGRGSANRLRSSRTRSFNRRNCFGCNRFGYGYPWGYSGFYAPYWWWDSGSSSDEDRARELDTANQMDQQNLEEQQMRQQGDQDVYASPSAPRDSKRAAAPPTEAIPPTVLVFLDRSRQEVQNYAIVGETLWIFSPQHSQKIPLSDLDLAATGKANDERGVAFRIPNPPEGQ